MRSALLRKGIEDSPVGDGLHLTSRTPGCPAADKPAPAGYFGEYGKLFCEVFGKLVGCSVSQTRGAAMRSIACHDSSARSGLAVPCAARRALPNTDPNAEALSRLLSCPRRSAAELQQCRESGRGASLTRGPRTANSCLPGPRQSASRGIFVTHNPSVYDLAHSHSPPLVISTAGSLTASVMRTRFSSKVFEPPGAVGMSVPQQAA